MRIGLYVRNLDEEFQLSVFRSVQEWTKKLGLNVICVQDGNTFPPYIIPCIDGILFLSSVFSSVVSKIGNQNISEIFSHIPMVSIGRSIQGVPSINIKNRASMEKLMNHLLKYHAYKKFLYVGGTEDHRDNVIREFVFRQSLVEAQESDPTIVYDRIHGNFAEDPQVIRDYISEHPDTPVDVIVCANDNMAIGTVKALNSCKNSLWKNCAVTGFDDIFQAKLLKQPLTTIQQPINDMASAGVNALYALLKGESISQVQKIESLLCIRESCGCKLQQKTKTDKDLKELDTILFEAQNFAFKTEQFQFYFNRFGQRLNETNSIDEILLLLPEFLNNFSITDFHFIIFTETDNVLFCRSATLDTCYGIRGEQIHRNTYITSILEHHQGEQAYVVQYLYSGFQKSGMILYASLEPIYSYICSSAILLSNAFKRLSLLDEEKEHSRILEQQVQARTLALIKANEQLKQESQKRIAVEAQVLKISELERKRFSMDLHDDICQRLAGISMMCKGLSFAPSNELSETIAELSKLLDETLYRTRRYAHDSFPMELDPLGIKKALGVLCDSIQKISNCTITYVWEASGLEKFDKNKIINIYRIVQESLQNISKHAHAKNASLSVIEKHQSLYIDIDDDGTGMQLSSDNSITKQCRGLGLLSVQYRADQINAICSIESAPMKGTHIKLVVPM